MTATIAFTRINLSRLFSFSRCRKNAIFTKKKHQTWSWHLRIIAVIIQETWIWTLMYRKTPNSFTIIPLRSKNDYMQAISMTNIQLDLVWSLSFNLLVTINKTAPTIPHCCLSLQGKQNIISECSFLRVIFRH